MPERIGSLLVRKRLITPHQLDEALKAQLIYRGRLGTILVELDMLELGALGDALSEQRNYPLARSEDLERASDAVIKLLTPEQAEKNIAVPFSLDGRRLKVAMASPYDPGAFDALGFITGYRIIPYIAPEMALIFQLERRYGVTRPERYIRLAPEKRSREPDAEAKPASKGNELFGDSSGYLSNEDDASAMDAAPRPSVDPYAYDLKPPVAAPPPPQPHPPGPPPMGAPPPYAPRGPAPIQRPAGWAPGMPPGPQMRPAPPPYPGIPRPPPGSYPPPYGSPPPPGWRPPPPPGAPPWPAPPVQGRGPVPQPPAPRQPVPRAAGPQFAPPIAPQHPTPVPPAPGAARPKTRAQPANVPPQAPAPQQAPPPAALPAPHPAPAMPLGGPASFSTGDLDAWAATNLGGATEPPPAEEPAAAAEPPALPSDDAPPLEAGAAAGSLTDAMPAEFDRAPAGPTSGELRAVVAEAPVAASGAEPAVEPSEGATATAPATPETGTAGPNATPTAPVASAAPTPEPPEPSTAAQPAAAREEGVELPAASGELQLADTWEFVNWQAGAAREAAVDLPGAPQGESPDLQLAEAWEYAKWEREKRASDAPSPADEPAPPEQVRSPEAAEKGPREAPALESAPESATPPSAPDVPPETAPAAAPEATATPGGVDAIRALLDTADRDAAVAKALLHYCEGRFSRAFLFAEQLDTAMLWRGTGEGSDDPGLAALRVDLQEPSVLRRAVEQKAAVHFDAPEGPADEALYVALSPRSPYLIIVPIFASGRAVSFLYAESALEPFSPEAEAELAEIAAHASRAYERVRAR